MCITNHDFFPDGGFITEFARDIKNFIYSKGIVMIPEVCYKSVLLKLYCIICFWNLYCNSVNIKVDDIGALNPTFLLKMALFD